MSGHDPMKPTRAADLQHGDALERCDEAGSARTKAGPRATSGPKQEGSGAREGRPDLREDAGRVGDASEARVEVRDVMKRVGKANGEVRDVMKAVGKASGEVRDVMKGVVEANGEVRDVMKGVGKAIGEVRDVMRGVGEVIEEVRDVM